MPSKKKKYNARFPIGRIKKIMQTDEEVGKVAQAVPIIISRTLELFVESLIKKSMKITVMKNARTLSPHHMKQCILSESRFDFLKDLVKNVPEAPTSDDDGNTGENWGNNNSQGQRRTSSDDTSEKMDQEDPTSLQMDDNDDEEDEKPMIIVEHEEPAGQEITNLKNEDEDDYD